MHKHTIMRSFLCSTEKGGSKEACNRGGWPPPEAEVPAAAEAASSPPCGAAEALALTPASEAAAELGCVGPGAALILSMRVSTSLAAICGESFDRVDTN